MFERNKSIIKYFKALDQLQVVIFNCYTQRMYPEKTYDYEKNIHKVRLKLFNAMKKIRTFLDSEDLPKFENFYEMIFSLNTLKLRVTDYATFEMCESEFKKVSQSLTDVLKHIILFMNGKNKPDLKSSAKVIANLSNRIDELEELYRSTLQVVSKDPIFFLFFVQDLIALRDALESFFVGWLNGKSSKNQ